MSQSNTRLSLSLVALTNTKQCSICLDLGNLHSPPRVFAHMTCDITRRVGDWSIHCLWTETSVSKKQRWITAPNASLVPLNCIYEKTTLLRSISVRAPSPDEMLFSQAIQWTRYRTWMHKTSHCIQIDGWGLAHVSIRRLHDNEVIFVNSMKAHDVCKWTTEEQYTCPHKDLPSTIN